MTKELEIEFKNLLTREEYINLLERFGYKEHDAVTQTNHYFDTADYTLRNQKSALRIREKGQQMECTLKTPAENGYYEITDKLDPPQARDIIENRGFAASEVKEALAEMDVFPENLIRLGSLTTHRIEFPYKKGLLVLDHSEYHGTEDFELEYEVEDYDTGKQIFKDLLDDAGIPTRSTDKKIARFMSSAKKR